MMLTIRVHSAGFADRLNACGDDGCIYVYYAPMRSRRYQGTTAKTRAGGGYTQIAWWRVMERWDRGEVWEPGDDELPF